MHLVRFSRLRLVHITLALLAWSSLAFCAETPNVAAPAASLASALPPEKWLQVEGSVDRGLSWLASQQAPDGSFPTLNTGQPGVTSLCVMAFLSRGHRPGFGPYGERLNRAIDYVLSCQKESGLFSYMVPESHYTTGFMASKTASYNHAISGLMLGEVYGHVTGERARKVKAAISKALLFTRTLQSRAKANAAKGGVRYLWRPPEESDADLSLTAWHMMFYRSAKNAEFNVPQQYTDEAVAFVRGCWNPNSRMFDYFPTADGRNILNRGMTGAGIVALSMAGQHNTPMALAAGDWLVAHPYRSFGDSYGPLDWYFYSTYYCSQAAAQLGGRYWNEIFPPIVDVFLKVQAADGAFPAEPLQGEAVFGKTYSTAMAVLALTPAYQLLPVYQR